MFPLLEGDEVVDEDDEDDEEGGQPTQTVITEEEEEEEDNELELLAGASLTSTVALAEYLPIPILEPRSLVQSIVNSLF